MSAKKPFKRVQKYWTNLHKMLSKRKLPEQREVPDWVGARLSAMPRELQKPWWWTHCLGDLQHITGMSFRQFRHYAEASARLSRARGIIIDATDLLNLRRWLCSIRPAAPLRLRRMPDGSKIRCLATYRSEWQALVDPVCRATGWKVLSYDPYVIDTGERKAEFTVREVRTLSRIIGGVQ